MKKLITKITIFLILSTSYALTYATSINVVAAENFYGELAKEIGGKKVNVTNILANPNVDPHLFTTSPKLNKTINNAQVIIYNGVGYDPWMTQLIKSSNLKTAQIINVGELTLINDGANPHIWYNPGTMEILAKKLATIFSKIDPASANLFKQNLKTFLDNQQVVNDTISAMKKKYKGTKVTATEPVYGYMAEALGLNMLGMDVQWKIMNDTEPSPKMFADYLELINNHKVKVIFYNSQTAENKSKQILTVAKKNKIPIVGVTETMPKNTTIKQWFLSSLKATDKALAKANQ